MTLVQASPQVISLGFFPGVERRRDRGDAMVPSVAAASADFAEHEEVRVAALLGVFLEGADIVLIEGITVDLLHRIDPEGVDAHVDELPIARSKYSATTGFSVLRSTQSPAI
jgi:hypothetical protein